MKKFIPFGDKVLVKREETQERTSGGIYIPEDAKELKQACRVLAAGPGKFLESTGEIKPMTVKVGDTVLVSKYAGTDIYLEREKLLVIVEDDVLGVIREEEGNG